MIFVPMLAIVKHLMDLSGLFATRVRRLYLSIKCYIVRVLIMNRET